MTIQKNVNEGGGPQKSALLVIDVQQGLFNKATPIYQADELLKNILELIAKAHAAQAY